jgi:hypothetical protein
MRYYCHGHFGDPLPSDHAGLRLNIICGFSYILAVRQSFQVIWVCFVRRLNCRSLMLGVPHLVRHLFVSQLTVGTPQ